MLTISGVTPHAHAQPAQSSHCRAVDSHVRQLRSAGRLSSLCNATVAPNGQAGLLFQHSDTSGHGGSSPAASLLLQHNAAYEHVAVPAAMAAHSHLPVFCNAAAAAAAMSAWKVLRVQQDDVSEQLLGSSNVLQLLQLSRRLNGSACNKIHAAQLAVMAAVLTAAKDVGGQANTTLASPAAAAEQHVLLNEAGRRHWHETDHAAALELTWQVVQVVKLKGSTMVSSMTANSLLTELSSVYLQETLHALHILAGQVLDMQQQVQLQQQLRGLLVHIPEQHVLSAIHACQHTQQLSAVVHWVQDYMTHIHVKAAFVQLARIYQRGGDSGNSSTEGIWSASSGSDSSSSTSASLIGPLLVLLKQHMPSLQPHHAASVVWSLGQLQSQLQSKLQQQQQQSVGSIAKQLLATSLQGVERLNHRVCAMLLHGIARLQLQVSEEGMLQLLQHTQQQMPLCDPQAMASMLWSLAKLQQQPGEHWLRAFYASSIRMLQHQTTSQNTTSSSSNGNGMTSTSNESSNGSNNGVAGMHSSSSHSSYGSSSGHATWQQSKRDVAPFNPKELSAMLSACAHLGLQPPSSWLLAASSSCQQQLQQFQQQELATVLCALARLRYQPTQQWMDATERAILQQLQHCTPHSLTLLLFAAVRLQPPQPQQWRQQQQHGASAAAGNWVSQLVQHTGELLQQQGLQQQLQHERHGLHQLQFNATDLALLAWSLGRQQWQHQCGTCNMVPSNVAQQQSSLQQLQRQAWVGEDWLAAYMSAAAVLLQRSAFSIVPRNLSLMVWGLGAFTASLRIPGTSNTGETCVAGQTSRVVHQLHAASGVVAGLNGHGSYDIATVKNTSCGRNHSSSSSSGASQLTAMRFWTAVEAQSLELLPQFSAHELSNVLWGAGALAHSCGIRPGTEWADLLACQCLDQFEQLSRFQLLAAMRGLMWLNHPKGHTLLHAAIAAWTSARVQTIRPQELLLLLHAVVQYRHVLQEPCRQALVAALFSSAQHMQSWMAAQVLYLLGKVQQQQIRRWRQERHQAAVAGSGKVAHHIGQQQAHSQHIPATAVQYSQQQHHVQWHQAIGDPVVPTAVVSELVQQVSHALNACSPGEISTMMWGLAQLVARQPSLQQSSPSGDDPTDSNGNTSSTGTSNSSTSSKTGNTHIIHRECRGAISAGDAGGSIHGSSSSSRQSSNAVPKFADTAAGTALLEDLYAHCLKQLPAFYSSELATVLYALHKLGASPPKAWIGTVVEKLTADLSGMDGQSLAALTMALSSFSWVPNKTWVGMLLQAASALETVGGFKTEWQRALFRDGLSALCPLAGEYWLQHLGGRARTSKCLASRTT